MGSKKVQPTTRGTNLAALVPKMRLFVEEILASENFDATAAARKVGYAQPAMRAKQLLADKRIQRALGKALQERITRCQLTADEVLEHLRNALFLDPLDLFERAEGGGYLVRSLEDIPVHVRRCITKIKQRQRIVGEGVEIYIEVELMSKDNALQAAMKHLGLLSGDGQINLNVGTLDLAELLERVESNRNNIVDARVIERIAAEEVQ